MTHYINPSQKILRHFDRLAAWQNGELFPPVSLEMDLSERCNLGCDFCAFRYTHSHDPLTTGTTDLRYAEMGDLMDFDLAKRIISQMAEYGMKSFSFSGGGEPLFHPRFSDIVRHADDVGLQTGLYTNGTLIDDERAQTIKRYCEWVAVSIDEPNREAYRKTKQIDLFAQACNGVRRLMQAEGKATVGLSFSSSWDGTSDDEVWDTLHQIDTLRTVLGVDYCQVRPRMIFNFDDPAQPGEDMAWVDKVLPVLERAALRYPGIDIRADKFHRYAHFERDYKVCYGVLFTGCITANGRVWQCVNRRGFPESLIGDLTTEPFAEVWARKRPQTDFSRCRIACCGDDMTRTLYKLSQPIPHQDFM